MRWLPGLQTLQRYELPWLPRDLMAGLVLTAMLVPVGIAYAVASGVPGIYGLYATIVPLLAYALFGPSRILVLGPDSSLAAVILAVVAPLALGDPMRAVAIASAMAIVSGLVCILIGLLKLGFVTELLSKPIRYGYMNGIALTVLISQLPKLLGFSIEGDGPLRSVVQIVRAIVDGEVNLAAFAVGGATLVAILLLLLVFNTVYHMWIGMQEIVVDYVHHEIGKLVVLMANTCFCMAIGFACAYALLKLSFGV